MRRKVLWSIGAVILLAQFFQPDRSVHEADPAQDFITITHPSEEIAHLLHITCYDCHSAHTNYPWYSYVTPVNFWLQHHINEGRDEFNMSEWGARSAKWRIKKLKRAAHELKEGDMPLPSYTWLHGEAQLTNAQRRSLIDYFAGL